MPPIDWGAVGLFIGGIAVTIDRAWEWSKRRNGFAPATRKGQEEMSRILSSLLSTQNEILKSLQRQVDEERRFYEDIRRTLTVLETRSDDAQRNR